MIKDGMPLAELLQKHDEGDFLRTLTLRWPGQAWHQRLDAFAEGRREIHYEGPMAVAARAVGPDPVEAISSVRPFLPQAEGDRFDEWIGNAARGTVDWFALPDVFASWGTVTTRGQRDPEAAGSIRRACRPGIRLTGTTQAC